MAAKYPVPWLGGSPKKQEIKKILKKRRVRTANICRVCRKKIKGVGYGDHNICRLFATNRGYTDTDGERYVIYEGKTIKVPTYHKKRKMRLS